MVTILSKFNSVVNTLEDKIALKEENRVLSYRDLDIQSNKIANVLKSKGIKKGDFVSLYLKRSIDTIVSILGVIKAGGVYIPLDPSHPIDRTNYIINDSNSNFVITNNTLLNSISNLNMIESINLLLIEDMIISEVSNYSFTDNPNDLMYVIYTSGTTGNPKGTLVGQSGVINLIDSLTVDWNITSNDVILQFATYSFDASIVDTFCSLLNGCTLYLINDEERMSEENFLNIIAKEHISIVPVIPTVFFNRIVNFANGNEVSGFNEVRVLGVGGELLLGDLARKFKSTIGKNTRFFNLYGPTETTVAATYYEVPTNLSDNVFSVPIGKALPGTKLYIVNEEGKICEKGEIGELCIASVGISSGYLNNEIKTKEVFIDNPFEDNILGGKIYKSGDLVKELVDGNLEFVSRKDTQVKIRGHRIEIAEIETRINEIKEINDAVVTVEEFKDEKVLKAFFTSDNTLDLNYIVKNLKETLPSYMIPTKMKQIKDIPFSPTGKADRKKLEKLEADIVSMIDLDNIIEPRNEIEEYILNSWKNTLGIDNIGVTEDFFEIGGHSLKIIAILSQLKQKYKTLSIKDFFDLKTVEKLALKVTKDSNESKEIFNNEFIKLSEYPKVIVKNVLPEVNTVLVTGSTGFLGSHIANNLVKEGKHVKLLVRGKDAKDRVMNTVKYYFNKEVSSNISVINGDLTKKHLGLNEDEFNELALSLNAIIHSAADVRHFGDRNHFEKINVEGTKNVFELVDINPSITFHHVSTIGIPHDLLAEGKWSLLEGTTEIPKSLSLESVYTDTKMEAEKWVLDKVKEGKQVFIYRMGNLVGRYNDGKFQSNIDANAFYRTMKLLILSNKAPKVQWMVDFTPIDFASEVVVKSVLSNNHSQRVYHVCHPNPIHFNKFVDLLNEMNLNIKLIDKDMYDSYLLSDGTSTEVKNLAVTQLDGDGANDSNAIYDSSETMKVLGINDIPQLNAQYINKLIKHAIDVGFIETKSLVKNY